jgi:hypothetical protein
MDVFDILPEMLLLVGGKRRSGNFAVGQGTPSVVLAVSLFGNAFEGVSTWAKSPRRRATKA